MPLLRRRSSRPGPSLRSDCHAEHTTDYRLDFRPPGHETHQVIYPDGRVQPIEKVFFNIVDARRIMFTYDIRLDARRLSVSLVTVEFFASRRGTRKVYTERLADLYGHEDRAQRLHGTEESLDRLGLHLLRHERFGETRNAKGDPRPVRSAMERTVANTGSCPTAGFTAPLAGRSPG